MIDPTEMFVACGIPRSRFGRLITIQEMIINTTIMHNPKDGFLYILKRHET